MKWSLFLLLAIWHLASAATTHANAKNDRNTDANTGREHKDDVSKDLAARVVDSAVRQPGAELVDAALSELRRIPRSTYRRKRSSQSIFTTAFRLLLNTVPTGPITSPSGGQNKGISGHLSGAVQLFEQAALQNNSDALYYLADLNFYGNYSHPQNLHVAFDRYHQLASGHGNATAQYMVALYYSTGLDQVVPRDQGKALLYHTFAATKGDARAEMATAFRHHSGIGTTKNCETAVKYYRRVAEKAVSWYRSGPPGGMAWIYHGWRISDEQGGIYGDGASASSAGMNAFKPSPHSDANAAIGDVIEYLDLMSQKGDSTASFNLGRLYHDGQRGLPKNFDLAKKYFFLVASRYWKRDGRLVENHKPGIEKVACKAAGYIGRMYLRGDGVSQNFDRASLWFDRGISLGEPQAQYGLGLMLLQGHGGRTNVRKAMELFRVAAEQDYAPAQVQMGKLYLDQGSPEDVRIANNHFELAARHGSMEALYYLAELLYHGVGREKLCGQALLYYKNVAEKAEPLVSSWEDANEAYEVGEYGTAYLEYLMAAEQGYEKAQTNVAFMLDTMQSKLPLLQWFRSGESQRGLLHNPQLALMYWTRSSRQSNVDSLVKIGDYYFYGIGAESDISKAVACYAGASDYSQSAQALYNLGWMHENGMGLKQDFHLAKRYYDQALEVNVEAYLPVTLSLIKLRARSAWNTITRGPVHSIQDEPSVKKHWSFAEWIANFLQDDGTLYDDEYFDDYYDTIGMDNDGYEDDGVVEGILIIGITVSLVFLLWWRQRIQQANGQADEARRREQGLQPQPPAAPPHGDGGGIQGDAFVDHAANGIGL